MAENSKLSLFSSSSVDLLAGGTGSGVSTISSDTSMPPYTDYDRTNHIEKAAVSLVGFEKTGEIQPGQSETVTITVNRQDFVSYDDVQARTYILEAGDYLLTAAANAHAAVNNFLAYAEQTGDGLFGGADAGFVGKWTYTYSQNSGVDNVTYATSLTGVEVTN